MKEKNEIKTVPLSTSLLFLPYSPQPGALTFPAKILLLLLRRVVGLPDEGSSEQNTEKRKHPRVKQGTKTTVKMYEGRKAMRRTLRRCQWLDCTASNIGMIWKEVAMAYARQQSGICLEGVRETIKKASVRIAGVSAEIQTKHLKNASRHCYGYISPLSQRLLKYKKKKFFLGQSVVPIRNETPTFRTTLLSPSPILGLENRH
jgi:hypothetical protein